MARISAGRVLRNLGGLGDTDARALSTAVSDYRQRATATDAVVGSLPLGQSSDPASWAEGKGLRWVILHLINETVRHAGHADATRELLDGKTGE